MPFFAALAGSENENGSDYFTLQRKVDTPRMPIEGGASRTYTTSGSRSPVPRRTVQHTPNRHRRKDKYNKSEKQEDQNWLLELLFAGLARADAHRQSHVGGTAHPQLQPHLYQGLFLPSKDRTAAHTRQNSQAPHGVKRLCRRRRRPGPTSPRLAHKTKQNRRGKP